MLEGGPWLPIHNPQQSLRGRIQYGVWLIEEGPKDTKMDREFDVLGQYRAITSKLKRRFLKKPNVSEASSQFGSLAKELKRQDCPQYAGFCSLAKARCENTLSNATGEVEALTEAARLFLEAEKNCVELRCPTFEEHLTEAIHLYNQAIKTHCAQGNSALGACLCLEIGDALRHMNRPHEAMVHYQHAAELQHQNPIDALQSMTLVASCKIDTGRYAEACMISPCTFFSVNCNIHEYFGCTQSNDHDAVSPFQMHHVVHLSVPRDSIFCVTCLCSKIQKSLSHATGKCTA